ncbi:molybdopterin molybdotransferase MoeA [Arachidicoccus terrestris]|uniref:molybdopterin molybdotransferase MoeA n=1 Tax=Arachidicoccus terrestris TaxID=2875539 RepID=UPI001CC5529D|nr:molybdopterin molybdotransferase MoeA [Arachidicoccus terrestris]UAY56700.1 molybdopterin molybdotransferase MoeA [Arachidicoccus terrestris]
MDLITVKEAEDIIQLYVKDYGSEEVPYTMSSGRVLAEHLYADRDLPPFNRATVDGIAIRATAGAVGSKSFTIIGTQAAGEPPIAITTERACVEVMTGAALDPSLDAVIRYEDISVENGIATIKGAIDIKAGMNLHVRGKDKRKGEMVAAAPRLICPALIGLAASIGKTTLTVKKLPRVAIISTGDEMVPPESAPTPFQLRRSNGIVMQSVLQRYMIQADTYHLNDDIGLIRTTLAGLLKDYDVLLLSGGVSMGKFDYVPQALQELGVAKRFHKIRQRPGKPFWFGTHHESVVFAFPGNPVSVFMCLNRYFVPWLERSLKMPQSSGRMAVLGRDIEFKPPLQYFIQVQLETDKEGVIVATPFDSNGSGDFSNLIYANAFMELPLERTQFRKGELFKVWQYKN